ncbi:type IV secretory system conjugative DNA transfer family protein [Bradyrhizobium sp. CB2312]|uniref:type IV secretory system conjugative DNA transfer family protein n=1 Tax=Bradyrhizobium sp. CB2312 TaxID=3039155 RepID=UPI0024B19119|nr:type IV secretory system conjugative DNA transfer family protein [Bradyrhizobium sp. CB2312]WFU72906.1 type IV secretory system conjugative DNA transfer family protein [Bradyrhizobium sp. CB2312]
MNPTFPRLLLTLIVVCFALAIGYPAAFIAQHGWLAASWPPELAGVSPAAWALHLFDRFINFPMIFGTYWEMAQGKLPAFAGGGTVQFYAISGVTTFIAALLLVAGTPGSIRDNSGVYGDAKWASNRTVRKMNRGLEVGIDPITGKAVRIQVEGNLLTIAPPRTGKTDGFIIPNLAFPEPDAWAGPAVVIDPKGDAYRAVKRRRESMGRVVRCIDPLKLAGGVDRWNPLILLDPSNILYLQSMALSLLPPAKEASENSYFQSRASDLIVAAILATVRNGKADPVGAALLLMKPDDMIKAVSGATDHSSQAAVAILEMDARSRDSITSTAQQATQWLRDSRMQDVVQAHTFELADLAAGNVDLFIVLPAGEEKKILAPYVRWLLADLFASVRRNRPSERIIAFIDEAFVLGRFDAVLNGVGELPGYGLSIWTFWQSRSQLVETFNVNGADTMIATAEMLNVFNLPAALPKENEYWSNALGTYTGIKITTTPDSKTGKPVQTKTSEALRLVPASDIPTLLQKNQIMFLNSLSHTPDRVKLKRTVAHDDPRFASIVDFQPPVGKSN